jgi:hypothetical protein
MKHLCCSLKRLLFFFAFVASLGSNVYDSHSIAVTPKSLYLAQLAERLGKQAVENIGY